MRHAILVVALIAGLVADANAQPSIRLETPGKGATPPGAVTSTPVDANHTGLDINCVSGCSGGGGTVTADQGSAGSDPWPVEFLTAQHTIVDSGSITCAVSNFPATVAVTQSTSPWVVSGTVTASGPLTDTQLRATPVPISGSISNTSFGATQGTSPWVVSGTVTATGPLTDTQLRATPVPVDGSGSTQPISGSITCNAGTDLNTSLLSTAAKQDTGNTSLASIDGKITACNTGAVVISSGTTTVTQGTASNLHTAATLDAETTKVIGTVRVLGNGGATLDATVGAGTAPTNMAAVGGLYNSTEPSPSTGQSLALQQDSKGRLRMVLMDAAGNTRGVNVDGNNNLGAVLAAETTKVIGTVNQGTSPWVVAGGGTAGSAASGVVTVQGIASMTPVQTDLTKIAGSTVVADPCQVNAKVYTPISQTANTQLVTGTSAKKTYVCFIFVQSADAENLSLVAGTGSTCGTNTVAVVGGTTAAAGPNGAANGGWVLGVGGYSIAATTVNADNLCLFQSGSGRVAGQLVTVVQ